MKAPPLISMKSEFGVDRKSKASIIIRKVHLKERIDKYRVITLYSQSVAEEDWLMRKPFLKRFT